MITTIGEKIIADTISAEVYISSIVVVEEKGFVSADPLDTAEVIISSGERGPPGISEEDMVYAKRVDFTNDGDIIYKAEAPIGSTTNAPVWRIRKITIAVDSDITEEWAEGNSLFNKIWDNRLSLIYS